LVFLLAPGSWLLASLFYTENLICREPGAYDVISMENIQLEINGESRSIPFVSNILELIQHLGILEGRIAVELNGNIIRRKDWELTPVCDRDRVEIVQFVGGG
jgi:sulfur carrier protein